MSFYCRYMTGRDYCSRRDLECKPGAEGCVLRGRVVFADNDQAAEVSSKASGGVSQKERPKPRKPRGEEAVLPYREPSVNE